MIDEPLQLSLFASSTSPSTSPEASSRHLSEPATSSIATPPVTNVATRTTPIRNAMDKSSRAGAGVAGSSSSGAKHTVESAPQRMLPITIAPNTEAKMLAIPRPTTLGECSEEARPCPWVSCRHHLLLEVATPRQTARVQRPTSLRLNVANTTRAGRRPGLPSSAAAALVRVWIDDAVELLTRMRYTCTFDVVRDHPEGLFPWQVAQLLNVSEQSLDDEARRAASTLRERIEPSMG